MQSAVFYINVGETSLKRPFSSASRTSALRREAPFRRPENSLTFQEGYAGITPVAYLTQLRMRLAERTLREGDTAVSKVGYALGYASEGAFSNAFKRFAGESPTRYRANARSTQAAN